jgi:hypothetical protein
MVEVFKTNINDEGVANSLLDKIHNTFNDHRANFDLQDCDKILRVRCLAGPVQSYYIMSIVREEGWYAEILPDDEPPPGRVLSVLKDLVTSVV